MKERSEYWKPIENWPGYSISSIGRVRSYWTHKGNKKCYVGTVARIRPLCVVHDGRPRITFYKNNKAYNFKVCRLVALAFIGPCPEGYQVCHNNGCPADNRVSNLRWDTAKNNMADKRKHGTHLQGEKQNGAKLKEHDVKKIVYMNKLGFSRTSIERIVKTKHQNVVDILLGRTWNWLTGMRQERSIQ